MTIIFSVLNKNNLKTKIICCFIIVLSVIFSAATTFSSIYALSSTQFVVPCYLQPFFGADRSNVGYVSCCGHWQNVSRIADTQCSEYDDKIFL